jgi:hypothetical protein
MSYLMSSQNKKPLSFTGGFAIAPLPEPLRVLESDFWSFVQTPLETL